MVYIDTTALTHAAIGGTLLAIATSLNYAVRGRITGMSGYLYSIVSFNRKELPDRLTTLGGMLLISGLFYAHYGYSTYTDPSSPVPFGPKSEIVYGLSYFGFIISGFLVGFGAKLQNGCTSGHGLCGLPRFSLRSYVSVGIFLVTAIVISTIQSRFGLPFITSNTYSSHFSVNNHITAFICLALGVVLPIISHYLYYIDHGIQMPRYFINQFIAFAVGVIFGLGLLISGMTRRAKIHAFLTLDQNWDPSLLIVLGVGVIINIIIFNYILHVKKTTLLGQNVVPIKSSGVDWKLIVGALCFGLGWGIGSLCPGPFLMLFSVFTVQIQVFWGLACIVGMFGANFLSQKTSYQPLQSSQNSRGSKKSY